jgi:hypothetical protein
MDKQMDRWRGRLRDKQRDRCIDGEKKGYMDRIQTQIDGQMDS